MLTRSAAVLTLLGLLSVSLVAGCGDDKSSEEAATSARTPADLIVALQQAASRGKVERLARLVDEAALQQTGAQWLGFAQRTGVYNTLKSLQSLPPADLVAMQKMGTQDFFADLRRKAPLAASKFFIFYTPTDVEADGQVLVYVTNSVGEPVFLAMKRTGDGSLQLMAESELKPVYDRLVKQLGEKLRAEAAAAAATDTQ